MMATATLRYIMRDPSTQFHKRGVAQPGSAPPWGGGGRRFKSSRPDQYRCSCSLSPVFGFVSPSAMMKSYLWVADPRASRHSRASGNPGFEWYRALGARFSKANCGWLRPCTLGDFSLLVQREVTKRKHARVAHRPKCGRFPATHPGRADPRRARSAARKSTGLPRILRLTLAKPGARQLVGRIIRGSTRTGARLKAPGFTAALGSQHGIFNPPQTLTWSIYRPLTPPKGIPMPRIELGCSPPRMARPSIAAGIGGFARLVFEPEARFPAPGELGRAPMPARSVREISRHPGRVSFGYFSLHEQRQFRRERNWTRFSAPRRGPRQGWRGSKVTRPRCGNRN